MSKDAELSPKELLGLEEWGWEDFKLSWQKFSFIHGEDIAWQLIYELWQMRAGETKEDLDS